MPLDVAAAPELVLIELLLVAVTLPLSLIAARGFWDAPFGRMIKPLPLVFAFYILLDFPNVVGMDLPRWYFYLTGAPAIAFASYAAFQGALLLSERQEV